MFLGEVIQRIKYWKRADRIGPDVPTSHWKLYFRSSMVKLCQHKFKHFDGTAEFRAGSYATGCSRISIGKRVIVRPLSYFQSDASEFGGDITIEDDVMLGPAVHIYTNNHASSASDRPLIDQGYSKVAGVTLKRGCWIGANVTLLPGVTVGENSVVGAGSIVTKDIPARTIAAGVPARIIKTLD